MQKWTSKTTGLGLARKLLVYTSPIPSSKILKQYFYN